MNREIDELLEKLKSHASSKNEAIKDLEVVKRERNFLNESMKELKKLFESVNNKWYLII